MVEELLGQVVRRFAGDYAMLHPPVGKRRIWFRLQRKELFVDVIVLPALALVLGGKGHIELASRIPFRLISLVVLWLVRDVDGVAEEGHAHRLEAVE